MKHSAALHHGLGLSALYEAQHVLTQRVGLNNFRGPRSRSGVFPCRRCFHATSLFDCRFLKGC